MARMDGCLESRRALVLLVLAACVGCVGTPDRLAKKVAKLDCQWLEKCEGTLFEEAYRSDMERCRNDLESSNQDAFDLLVDAGCDYDKQEARKCIRAGRKEKSNCSLDSFDVLVDACEDVFDCPAGLGLDEELDPDLTAERDDDVPVMGPACEAVFGHDL